MKRFSEVVADIRAGLAVTLPTFDTTVGQPGRKMIDAVSEEIAEAYVDAALKEYQYDINAKVGADLDDFVANFGFARRAARRATGTVTFERQSPAQQAIIVPPATRVATADIPSVTFETVVAVTLAVGETTISAPVQAVRGGADGNVSAGSINRGVSGGNALSGFNSLANVDATSNGRDAESDEALRKRFKRTVFRNLAGVEEMFIGVALENEFVTQANAIGIAKRFFERVEVVGGSATSTLTSAGYIYPNQAFFGTDIQGGEHFTPGVHFQFDHTQNPPVVTSLDSGVVPDGVYDLDYAYIPQASRNDPTQGITNRIDVYVSGEQIIQAVETLIFKTSRTFTATAGAELDRTKFRRVDNSMPVAGNYFMRLGFAPVTDPSVSNTITIGGNTYTKNVDFWLVNDITPEGGTATSLSGIELRSVANGGSPIPTDGTVWLSTYLFNAVPREVQDSIFRWRLISTDVRVHTVKKRRMAMHAAIILEPGYTLGQVQGPAETAVRNYLMGVGFNGVIQVSDILSVLHGISGIDAVRFITSTDDGTDYAIQEVTPSGGIITIHATPAPGTRRAQDVIISEDEEPILYSLRLVPKAQNTWGTGA